MPIPLHVRRLHRSPPPPPRPPPSPPLDPPAGSFGNPYPVPDGDLSGGDGFLSATINVREGRVRDSFRFIPLPSPECVCVGCPRRPWRPSVLRWLARAVRLSFSASPSPPPQTFVVDDFPVFCRMERNRVRVFR